MFGPPHNFHPLFFAIRRGRGRHSTTRIARALNAMAAPVRVESVHRRSRRARLARASLIFTLINS